MNGYWKVAKLYWSNNSFTVEIAFNYVLKCQRSFLLFHKIHFVNRCAKIVCPSYLTPTSRVSQMIFRTIKWKLTVPWLCPHLIWMYSNVSILKEHNAVIFGPNKIKSTPRGRGYDVIVILIDSLILSFICVFIFYWNLQL